MRLFKGIGGLFILVGAGCLVGMVFSIASTQAFLNRSLAAEGEVVDVVTRLDQDSDDDDGVSVHSLIRFRDRDGNPFVFQSSATASGWLFKGRKVKVRYPPGNPADARSVDTFTEVWGLSLFLLLFGMFFAGMGAPFFWLGIRDDLREKRALSYSREIRAKVKEVARNTFITVNGNSPYQIKAQWLDPDTRQVHVFKSRDLWQDPSGYVTDEVLVRTDPRNPGKYWMDISFLPGQP
jgi:hypothetical protein